MNWTLQLGVGAFIYILPSRTNPSIAHRQNNSGARHRTRFLYVPDISTCKLRLPSRWLVRCDVILISDRHKNRCDSEQRPQASRRQQWKRWICLKNCCLPNPKRILSSLKQTNCCRKTVVVRQFMLFNKMMRTALTRYYGLNRKYCYLYVAQMCKYDTITSSVLHDIIPLWNAEAVFALKTKDTRSLTLSVIDGYNGTVTWACSSTLPSIWCRN